MNIRLISLICALVLPVILCQCGDGGEKKEASGKDGGEGLSERENVAKEVEEKKDAGNLVGAARAVNLARTKTMNLSVLKQYAIGAHMASAVAGKFPADLAEVRKAGEIPDTLGLTDTNTGKGGVEPVYFPKAKADAGGDVLLLACPFANPDGTRTVAYTDGAVQHIPEAKYKEMIPAPE